MSVLFGIVYCSFWYASILAGYIVLYCPIFPILFISNKLYRIITDFIFRYWELFPTTLLRYFGTEFVLIGDRILHTDRAVLIVNHRTRTDWNFLWPVVHYAIDKHCHSMKFLLKNSVKNIPGPGWVMQLSCFLYIRRRWEQDRNTIKKVVQYIHELKRTYLILLFPEGTDLTPETLQKSHQFAKKYNFDEYYNVLHPRTAGFSFLVNQLQKQNHLDAIYDLTLIYSPDSVPETEFNLLKGLFPKKVYCDIKRYSKTDIPATEDDLKLFLIDRWREKEEKIVKFYKNNNQFEGACLQLKRVNHVYAIFSTIFWCLLPIFAIYLLINVYYFRIIVLVHTVVIVLIPMFAEYFLNFEIFIYFIRKKIVNFRR